MGLGSETSENLSMLTERAQRRVFGASLCRVAVKELNLIYHKGIYRN